MRVGAGQAGKRMGGGGGGGEFFWGGWKLLNYGHVQKTAAGGGELQNYGHVQKPQPERQDNVCP